jgi:hypothetical protein
MPPALPGRQQKFDASGMDKLPAHFDAYLKHTQEPQFRGSNCLLIVKSKSGKPIRHYSAYAGEEEILFLPKTSIRVLNTVKQPHQTFIDAEEIEEKAAPRASIGSW